MNFTIRIAILTAILRQGFCAVSPIVDHPFEGNEKCNNKKNIF